MTKVELKELKTLLLKLEEQVPGLTVMITDAPESKIKSLMFDERDFYCPLLLQIELAEDETNEVLGHFEESKVECEVCGKEISEEEGLKPDMIICDECNDEAYNNEQEV